MAFICPKCSARLDLYGRSYKCPQGHCYDLSKEGYVNLLISTGNSKNPGRVHGDNKMMVRARRTFLSLGHYSPIIGILSEMLADIGATRKNSGTLTVLDAGCGEGYYTERISASLTSAGIRHVIYGIDVSKDAVAYAARASKSAEGEIPKTGYAVASVNALPFETGSFDVVLSLFAPLAEREFARVLKDNGVLITVSPSEDHLFGLKKLIYDEPYRNPPPSFRPELFRLESSSVYESEMTLCDRESVSALFAMTPYYYNSKSGELARLTSIEHLETPIGFVFEKYVKKQKDQNNTAV